MNGSSSIHRRASASLLVLRMLSPSPTTMPGCRRLDRHARSAKTRILSASSRRIFTGTRWTILTKLPVALAAFTGTKPHDAAYRHLTPPGKVIPAADVLAEMRQILAEKQAP